MSAQRLNQMMSTAGISCNSYCCKGTLGQGRDSVLHKLVNSNQRDTVIVCSLSVIMLTSHIRLKGFRTEQWMPLASPLEALSC